MTRTDPCQPNAAPAAGALTTEPVCEKPRLRAWLRISGPAKRDLPASPAAWNCLADRVCGAGLAGLVMEQISRRQLNVDAAFTAKLRVAAARVAATNISMRHALEEIVAAFQAAGIPVLLLKGAALNLTLYDRPELRPMGDLDLLVRVGDVPATERALTRLGCERGAELLSQDFFPAYYYEREWFAPPPVRARIDLHARPFRPLRFVQTMSEDALFEAAASVRAGTHLALLPRRELMFLHLACHAAFHGCSRFLWLYDIKRFCDREASRIDWEFVLDRARVWRLSLPTLVAIEQTWANVGAVCPRWVIDALRSHSISWQDRLVLYHAPRDARSPIGNVLVQLLTTPGWRLRAGYLRAVLLSGAGHLAEVYPYRHRGWRMCARIWRLVRSPVRFVASTAQAALEYGGRVAKTLVSRRTRMRTRPQTARCSG